MSKKVKIPYCNDHGRKRDCFACGVDCKCYLLTSTDHITDKCSFYKSRYSVKDYEVLKHE